MNSYPHAKDAQACQAEALGRRLEHSSPEDFWDTRDIRDMRDKVIASHRPIRPMCLIRPIYPLGKLKI